MTRSTHAPWLRLAAAFLTWVVFAMTYAALVARPLLVGPAYSAFLLVCALGSALVGRELARAVRRERPRRFGG